MADTLDLISAMKSIGEVEDYLIDDPGWDRDNDEVRLFLSIIGRHFSLQTVTPVITRLYTMSGKTLYSANSCGRQP